MKKQRKKISEVFTPRMSEVNEQMYVTRGTLEKNLKRTLDRTTNTIIFGESGSGKSWLYKKVLKDEGIPFVVANCANASRLNSITDEIFYSIVQAGTPVKTGYQESKDAGINGCIAKATLKHQDNFDLVSDEKLLQSFRTFDQLHKGKKIIVLDNFEVILKSTGLINELADLIILLDDSRYACYNITFLIVGIPNDLLHYFGKTKNQESVSNRLFEFDEIKGLTREETIQVIDKGFEQLNITIDTPVFLEELYAHVFEVTLGIPQRVHEYCECLAYGIEDNDWTYEPFILNIADNKWLNQSLRQSYQVIESHLNSRDTKVARRNQVIFCIGKLETHSFDSAEIDRVIREEFPNTIPKTNMGIGSILSELSSGENPLLIKGSKVNLYSIKDPRYLMCIRVILQKNSTTEKVSKKAFSVTN